MAGHSKWHNIKRKKEVTDAKRSKVFTKIARLISVAARKGGGDVAANPALRLAVEKAKYAKMPKENIERAIQKGVGGADGDNYEEIVYEGFGPGGVALLIYTLTDNRNRTVSELKHLFSRHNGSIGEPGCTAYIFATDTKKPSYTVAEESDVLFALLDELDDHNDVQEFYTNLEGEA